MKSKLFDAKEQQTSLGKGKPGTGTKTTEYALPSPVGEAIGPWGLGSCSFIGHKRIPPFFLTVIFSIFSSLIALSFLGELIHCLQAKITSAQPLNTGTCLKKV